MSKKLYSGLPKAIIGAVVAMLVMTACSIPAPPDEIRIPGNSMIFGHIDAPEEIIEVELREYGRFYIPPFVKLPRVMIFNNGHFMAENLAPGKYFISAFNSNHNDFVLVNDKRTAYQDVIVLKEDEAKYIGSYRISNVQAGLLDRGDFDIRKTRKPSERRIIRHLFHVTEGTAWQAMLQKRIMELRQ